MSMWFDDVVNSLSQQQIINDSKTPSGKVHVGSLRGVLIHDVLYKALTSKGIIATYTYGIDDFDPLDDLPADIDVDLTAMLGKPLCNIPPPQGSKATDLANHYTVEFLDIFKKLNVNAKIYLMRDIYRSGQFNSAIDEILNKVTLVRDIYQKVSNANKSPNWYPFQVICEKCGKIGSSEVTHYDGKEVTYHCRENLVSWAKGCGYSGKISPFDGNGKLPWKLEWAAKWHTFCVTIEGGGKDHCTKGGSRDVAEQCFKAIFGKKPPLNIAYEFFLVSGAKMSSSKGVGFSAQSMADFMPAEVLRFLMVRSPAKRTVNFSTDLDYIVKLFNEYDGLIKAKLSAKTSAKQDSIIGMTEINKHTTAYHPIGFQLLVSLLQLPHIDVNKEISQRVPEEFNSPQYKASLTKRLTAAKYWLDNYSTPEQRLELHTTLPKSVQFLSVVQKACLNLLGANFPCQNLSENEYQTYIFDTARMTPIEPKQAFEAIYSILFDKNNGPKIGALFSYIDNKLLINNFSQVSYSLEDLWNATVLTEAQCKKWILIHRTEIVLIKHQAKINVVNQTKKSINMACTRGQGVLELSILLENKKQHLLRILVSNFTAPEVDLNHESNHLKDYENNFITALQKNLTCTFTKKLASTLQEYK